MEGCCGLCWYGLAVVGLVIVYKLVDHLIRRSDVGQYSDRYILVTGCDTGFGHEIAVRLDALGCHVFAGCLTENGETQLRKACTDRLSTFSLDVSKPDSVRNAFDFVKNKLPPGQGLWGVLNNAGIIGRCGPHEWLQLDDYRQVLGVNLLGLIDVTMTFLPLVKRSRGRVVNTASVFGRYTIAGCPPYCVSKYGVEAFTDGLRRSLRPYGCRAILIEPGFHKTPITSRENIGSQLEASWKQASQEAKEEFGEEFFRQSMASVGNFDKISSTRISDVVDAYEHALLGAWPRIRYVVGYDARFLWLPLQALPECLGDWLLPRMMGKNRPVPAVLKKRL